jgi:hypothetical protein
MVRECFIANTGIMFHTAALQKINLDPATLYPRVVPSDGSMQSNLEDALSPSYDELQLSKFWWILEWLPVRRRIRNADGTWSSKIVYVDRDFIFSICG